MSVLVETTAGEFVVDLYTDDCPLASKNFLKLCKLKYYHGHLFFSVQCDFLAQTGDPTGTGTGGASVYSQLYGEQARFFDDEINSKYTHNKKGMVGMAGAAPNTNGSQFYITLRDTDLDYLDKSHTLFGEIAEGFDTLDTINGLFVDKEHRPLQDVRILHTHILDDPFEDPPLLPLPPSSPTSKPKDEQVAERIPYSSTVESADANRSEQEVEESLQRNEAQSRAVVLEMIGDLPDADMKPPEEVLFVCKLNPVTQSEDLDIAFARFGQCKSEVIRDYKTGDSLCFAFVEFESKDQCEEAYFKMNNVLLDDRRIKVDFSQSVSKLWNKHKRKQPTQDDKKQSNKDRRQPRSTHRRRSPSPRRRRSRSSSPRRRRRSRSSSPRRRRRSRSPRRSPRRERGRNR